MTSGAKSSDRHRSLLKGRPRHLRWLVLALLPIAALTSPTLGRPEWMHEIFETLGVTCLVACLVGRGWASVYVAGRKNQELVTAGPYSVVRNPLYVFSFIGVVGIGLLSEMMTLLALAVIVFVLYHRTVVGREEKYLAGIYGDVYARYVAAVPRWFPAIRRWCDIDTLEVRPRLIARHLRDSGLFFLAFLFFEVCEYGREIDLITPFFYVP